MNHMGVIMRIDVNKDKLWPVILLAACILEQYEVQPLKQQ